MVGETRLEAPALKELSSLGAENSPNDVAFGNRITGREVTWSEFHSQSLKAANAFQKYAVQGDRIAFLCEGSVEHITLWNGALNAGCIVSNLHTRGSPATVAYCIDKLAPSVLVIDEEFSQDYRDEIRDQISHNIAHVVVIGEEQEDYEESFSSFLAEESADQPDIDLREDDITAIMWTSGTTGQPKGWCFTNRGLLERGMKMLSTNQLQQDSRGLQGLTPSFAAWYSGILPVLLKHTSMYFVNDWDPELYLRLIEEKELTRLTLVPTMWQEMLQVEDFDQYDLSSLRVIGASGEQLTDEVLHDLRENICENVINAYAATESLATSIVHSASNDEPAGTVGKPTPGTNIRIIAPGGSPDDTQPPGETGEIIISGTDQPVWAWRESVKVEEEFTDGWWYSGDLGYKDEDGYFYLEGRKDFTIMSKGIKIHPTPIEERLNDHPKVEESAVVGVEDEEYGEKVTAIVSVADPTLEPTELDQWCLDDESIAQYERPRAYEFVEGPLSKTDTGKLDRKSTANEILD